MSKLKQQILWYQKAQWTMAGAMFLLTAAFYFAGYQPATRKLADLRNQIETQRNQLNTSQARARNLPIVALEVDKLRLRLERFDKKLPRQPEIDKFIKDVTQLNQQASLKKFGWQPGLPKRSSLFGELPISMNFEGDFVNVFNFLRQTEDMQRLTRVRNIQIKARDGKLGNVEVQLTMNIYFSEG